MKFICGFLLLALLPLSINAQWTRHYLSVTSDLYDINFTSHGHGYIAGQSSTLYKTRDSGQTWQKLSIGSANNLRAVYFTDTLRGFTFGENAVIRRTTDGAKTWQDKFFFTGSFLVSATFANPRQGVAVGQRGLIVSTQDSGVTWKLDTIAFKKNINAVSVTPGGTFWAVGDSGAIFYRKAGRGLWNKASYATKIRLNDIQVLNDSVFLVSGGMADTTTVGKFFNILLYTKTAGQNWSETDIPEAKQINTAYFFHEDTGYLAGTSGLVVKTYGHGQANGKQVTASSNSISALTFVSRRQGFCVGDGGLLMKTTNAGGYGTGLNEYALTETTVFPNPCKAGAPLYIKQGWQYITITDICGKTISVNPEPGAEGMATFSITVPGIYYLNIYDKGFRKYLPLFIE